MIKINILTESIFLIRENLKPSLLNEKSFLNYIDTWRFPEPDLLVRTWWDIRLSWFLQYVSDYSEFYFSDKYWPDFDKIEFQKAIDSFNNAKRNHWK